MYLCSILVPSKTSEQQRSKISDNRTVQPAYAAKRLQFRYGNDWYDAKPSQLLPVKLVREPHGNEKGFANKIGHSSDAPGLTLLKPVNYLLWCMKYPRKVAVCRTKQYLGGLVVTTIKSHAARPAETTEAQKGCLTSYADIVHYLLRGYRTCEGIAKVNAKIEKCKQQGRW